MRTGLCLFAVAVSVVAQTAVTSGQIGATAGIIGTSVGGFSLQSITGRPYSAEQVTDRVQTLADGTRITQTPQTTKLYRDSAGRTRTEHIFTPPPGLVMARGPSFIQIVDPVAGYRYMLEPRNQTARRSAFAPMVQRPNVVPAIRPGYRPICPPTPPVWLPPHAHIPKCRASLWEHKPSKASSRKGCG